MNNYQQAGNVVEVPQAAAAVVAGQIVVIGAILAVANSPADVGEPFNATRTGVYLLPKSTGVAFTQGQPLMWDASAKAFAAVGSPAAGDVTGAAVAFDAAASAATTVLVLLPGLIGSVAA